MVTFEKATKGAPTWSFVYCTHIVTLLQAGRISATKARQNVVARVTVGSLSLPTVITLLSIAFLVVEPWGGRREEREQSQKIHVARCV